MDGTNDMKSNIPLSESDAIRCRRSVRTFDGAELLPEHRKALADFIGTVSEPYGVPVEWRLLDAEKEGLGCSVIVGAKTYIAGKLRRVPHAEEAFGYALEKILIYARRLGIGSTWIAGTLDRGAFERAMECSDGEIMPCVSPLGYAAEKMSLRERLMRKGTGADSRMDFGALFFKDGFDTPQDAGGAGRLLVPLELARLSPSAVNRQPWRAVVCGGAVHFYEKHSAGYLRPDGTDIQKIDMGIAMSHFEAGLREENINFEFTVADPGLPVGAGTEYTATFITE